MNSKIHDIPNSRIGIVAKKDVFVKLNIFIEHWFLEMYNVILIDTLSLSRYLMVV